MNFSCFLWFFLEKEAELSQIREKFSSDSKEMEVLFEKNRTLFAETQEKTAKIEGFQQELANLRSVLTRKEEELNEILLSENMKERSLQEIIAENERNKEEIKRKKQKIGELEKKNEILEREGEKINKLLHHKLQEIDNFRLQVTHPHELEEVRAALETTKRINMVSFLFIFRNFYYFILFWYFC